MCWTDDPVADYLRYDRKREQWLETLPKCDHCKQPIQDERYFEIEGDNVCKECLEDYCEKHYEVLNYKIN